MPVISSDLKLYLSGGASNSDPNASLGGIISSVELGTSLHNLFDVVNNSESSAGDTEYRCLYVKNTNGTSTLTSATIGIYSNTSSTNTTIELAPGTSAINGTEQTVGNESTAPTGVTWNTYSLGNLAAGDHKAFWIKRIVNSSAAAYNTDTAVLEIVGIP